MYFKLNFICFRSIKLTLFQLWVGLDVLHSLVEILIITNESDEDVYECNVSKEPNLYPLKLTIKLTTISSANINIGSSHLRNISLISMFIFFSLRLYNMSRIFSSFWKLFAVKHIFKYFLNFYILVIWPLYYVSICVKLHFKVLKQREN